MYKNHLKQLSRKLEKEYGLQEVSNFRKPEDRARTADRKELEESRRLGTDVRAVRTTILDCLERTDGGKAFRAALDECGLKLSNGDRRDCFVVVDQAGGQHALNKKLTGLTLAQMRERFADLDRAQLPSVDQAKEAQREMREGRMKDDGAARDAPQPERPREPEREIKPEERHPGYAPSPAPSGKEREPPTPPVAAKEPERPAAAHGPEKARAEEPLRAQTGDLNATRADIRLAWSLSKSGEAFAAALEDKGYILASVTPEEARASERAAAFAKEVGNYAPQFREGEIVVVNDRGGVYRLDAKTTGDDRAAIEKYTATIDRDALLNMTDAKAVQQEARQATFAHARANARPATAMETKILRLQELAQYGGLPLNTALYNEGITLAKVDVAGKESVEREHRIKYHEARIAGDYDAKLRPVTFTEGELVAVTKSGSVHRLNPQRIDLTRLEQSVCGAYTASLSSAREFFATDRAAEKAQRQQGNAAYQEHRQQRMADRTAARETIIEAKATQRGRDYAAGVAKGAVRETVDSVKDAGLKVMNAGGVTTSLASFAESLLFGFMGGTGDMTPQPTDYERAHAALESMAGSMERGECLSTADVANLLPTQVVNIARHGDDYVRGIIDDLIRERERDTGRELEQ